MGLTADATAGILWIQTQLSSWKRNLPSRQKKSRTKYTKARKEAEEDLAPRLEPSFVKLDKWIFIFLSIFCKEEVSYVLKIKMRTNIDEDEAHIQLQIPFSKFNHVARVQQPPLLHSAKSSSRFLKISLPRWQLLLTYNGWRAVNPIL